MDRSTREQYITLLGALSYACRWVLACMIVSVIVAGVLQTDLAAAGFNGANTAENATFKTLKERFDDWKAKVLVPLAVDNVSSSINADGTENRTLFGTFDCTGVNNTQVQTVKVYVSTKLYGWTSVGAATGAAPSAAAMAAIALIGQPSVNSANNVKTIDIHLGLFLNQPDMDKLVLSSDNLDKAKADALLYHEFLHAQIGLQEYMNADNMTAACQCNKPVFKVAPDSSLSTWEAIYTGNVVKQTTGYTGIVKKIVQVNVGASGDFDVFVDVPQELVQKWTANEWSGVVDAVYNHGAYHGSANSPGVKDDFEVKPVDPDKIEVKGKLKSAQDNPDGYVGWVIIYLDPPGIVGIIELDLTGGPVLAATTPVFPSIYIGIGAALGAGILAYFLSRKLAAQKQHN